MIDGTMIREATESDIPEMNAIYNQYIVGSHVSFDTEAWTDQKRLDWFVDRTSNGYPFFVALSAGDVIGMSWSGPWRHKAAYRRSAETTVVLRPDVTGSGVGTVLYETLLERLVELGFHRAYAIVALPNEPSVRLHLKLAFTELGVLDEAGFKDGSFVSTMLLERRLDQPSL
ncbi:MAG: GNAT family N-acetyltransferase [Acidimicrobiia bacterium]